MKQQVAMIVMLGIGWMMPHAFSQDPKPQDPKPAPVPEARDEQTGAKPGAASPPRHPLEGVYQLRKRTHQGMVDSRPHAGYVALTHQHMLLCMISPGTDAQTPLVRSAVRSWKQKNDMLETEVKIGFYTDDGGKITLDPRGDKSKRRIEVARGLLRIYQDELSYLEFERVE